MPHVLSTPLEANMVDMTLVRCLAELDGIVPF